MDILWKLGVNLRNPNRTAGLIKLYHIDGGTPGLTLSNYIVINNNFINTSYFLIWNNRFHKISGNGMCRRGMTGGTKDLKDQELYDHLRFWFCKEPGLATLLIIICNHWLKITVVTIFKSALIVLINNYGVIMYI